MQHAAANADRLRKAVLDPEHTTDHRERQCHEHNVSIPWSYLPFMSRVQSCALALDDATTESPATCIAERYATSGGNAWHVRGNFGEFSGYFSESIVI
jgi:hypothetical protein